MIFLARPATHSVERSIAIDRLDRRRAVVPVTRAQHRLPRHGTGCAKRRTHEQRLRRVALPLVTSTRVGGRVGVSVRLEPPAANDSVCPAATRQAMLQYRPSRMWRPLPPGARSSRYQPAGTHTPRSARWQIRQKNDRSASWCPPRAAARPPRRREAGTCCSCCSSVLTIHHPARARCRPSARRPQWRAPRYGRHSPALKAASLAVGLQDHHDDTQSPSDEDAQDDRPG